MSIEQLRLKTVGQSVESIHLSLADLMGAIHLLLDDPKTRPLGTRVDAVHRQIAEELERIQYVIHQGSEPKTQAQLVLGQKVQDAINEISQI